jgi:hypothetical protein
MAESFSSGWTGRMNAAFGLRLEELFLALVFGMIAD